VKADSKVKIMSLSPLGENHLEVSPGSASATLAPAGQALPTEPYLDFNAITAQLNTLGPEVQQLIQTFNQRATELKETLARVNDLLNDRNRTNVAASLDNVRGMLEENRAKLKSTMSHVEASSAKMGPLLDDLKKTVQQADQALVHIDALVGENRPDVRQAVIQLRAALASTVSLTAQLDRTMNVNAENIDELLDSFRHAAENLKEFTETIKTRPYTLIRSSSPSDRKPGGANKP
jgi:ABC-type transporter Mla subunit MlaD